ncbi:uncharacterized protein METZ01_LOCUS72063 [marine metagenome]|uniref:2-amino-4-hydroxy-6-hydroxymethyldihydropteridine diphosphokinase n=1 Tax=marine metagenome TaxID=408172 RepID=A0A381TTP0_9ZZZZ
MEEVYIGIGSNLEPIKNIKKAKKELKKYFKCYFSKTYPYKSMGFKGPDFLNLVAKFSTNLDLIEVQKIFSKIETLLGRGENQHGLSNRVIDIDILLFGNKVLDEGRRSLPHKNLNDCRFVLEPLVELSPNENHPIHKKTFKEILDNIDQ